MARITYVNADGTETEVDAADGESVMRAALLSGVEGIVAECGGNCSCATCHVWVRDGWQGIVGSPADLEDDMLDLGVTDRREGSRLSCQITVSDALDGLVVDIPPDQP